MIASGSDELCFYFFILISCYIFVGKDEFKKEDQDKEEGDGFMVHNFIIFLEMCIILCLD